MRTAFPLKQLGAGWRAELERPEHAVKGVYAPVAHHAAAEVPPGPPTRRMVGRVVRSHRRGPEPCIPVQCIGNGRGLVGPLTHKGAPSGVAEGRVLEGAPGHDLADFADGSVPRPLTHLADAIG